MRHLLLLLSLFVVALPAQAAKIDITLAMDAAQSGGGGRTGTGSGTATLDLATNTLTYSISFSGLSGAETAAHIHGPAAPGVDAGVLYGLPAGSPKTGTINIVAGAYTVAQQIDQLLHGLWYVNVHSTNFPGGEIRGQFYPQQATFTMNLDAAQAGGAGRTGSGTGTATLDILNNQLSYAMSYSGLSGTEFVAHFHGPAAPGVDAGVLYGLPDGSPKAGTINIVAGAYSVVQQITDILNDLWYVNIHTTTFGGGEIRGQVLYQYITPSVKNDYNNDGIAGWIWKGQSNGVETQSQNWQLTFPLYSPNWSVPNRFFTPVFPDQANWELLTSGDFNKDGDADILWRHKTLATWKVWQMQNGLRAAQNAPADFDIAHEWTVVGAGDTDKDGDDDVILNKASSGEVIIWQMQDHAIAATHNVGTKAGYTLSRIGDFNKDGDVDLLFRQNSADVLITWEIQANVFVQERALANTGTNYNPVCAGDFDKDGDDDIMLVNSSTLQEKWFVMENYARTQTTGATNVGFVFKGCADYDGDGDADMLWQRSADDANRAILQQNYGTTKQTVYTNAFGGVNPGAPGYGFVYRGNSN
jgi:hypothetical protein